MGMLRHSIIAGKCYRDRFGAIYRVTSFDGSGVQCVVYSRDARGRLVEREHADSWSDFLEELQGEVECPQPQ
jgi:YD repeat-containing protein